MTTTSPARGTSLLEETEQETEQETAAGVPWQSILHNDPVNVVTYVTRTLVKVLKCSTEDAERYMMIAHTMGKAAVFDGSRSECENIVTQLGNHSLWATMEKAGS